MSLTDQEFSQRTRHYRKMEMSLLAYVLNTGSSLQAGLTSVLFPGSLNQGQ